MLWDGCEIGHALFAPYTAKLYRSLWDKILISDNELFAPIACTPDGAGLKVSIGGADQLDMSEGSAIIDGVYYWTDGVSWSLDRPGSGYYAYTVVLRKTQLDKTLVAELLGPIPYVDLDLLRLGGWPEITQTSLVWDVIIAHALADADSGLLAVHDQLHRLGPNHSQIPALIYRQGNSGSDTWDATGTDNIALDESNKMQVGTTQWTGVASTNGQATVFYNTAFTYDPLVFIQPCTAKIVTSVSGNQLGFTLTWRCMDATTFTSIDFFWMAIGKKEDL